MSKPMIEMRSSTIHGNGVFALRDIPAGTEIVEYAGKRLTHARADHKYGGTSMSGHTFLFTLNADYVIDGNQDGNDARWINHSCDPNCEAETDDGRVFIRTLRNIAAGEELFYDYGLVIDEPYTPKLKAQYPCWCGSKNCRGTLLAPKRGGKATKLG